MCTSRILKRLSPLACSITLAARFWSGFGRAANITTRVRYIRFQSAIHFSLRRLVQELSGATRIALHRIWQCLRLFCARSRAEKLMKEFQPGTDQLRFCSSAEEATEMVCCAVDSDGL